MIAVITSNTSFEYIYLPYCQFCEKDMIKLFEVASLIAQNTELQYLEMARCELTKNFLVGLAQALCTHNELHI